MAAEQGDSDSQCTLGSWYSHGEGVPKDYSEAVRYYRSAAEKGNPVAQHNLGVMYLNGHGVSKNKVEAYAWINLAAAKIATVQSKQMLVELEAEMGPEQIAQAQKLSRELFEKSPKR
jgi:TPR repeat protein